MEYFRNEDSNIDFMVSVCKAGHPQPEDLQPPTLGAVPMVHHLAVSPDMGLSPLCCVPKSC